VVLASTTGVTAKKMLNLLDDSSVRLIVMTHEGPGAPKTWRFDPSIREKLVKNGHTVIDDPKAFFVRMAVWAARTFGIRTSNRYLATLEEILGAGGQVGFKITRRAAQRNLLARGETVVAVAGRISGADTALALKITETRPFKAALLEVIAAPERECLMV
jgi:hypothetical protein